MASFGMPNTGNDQGFFRQMAQRRIGARRPAPPMRPPMGGFGAPPNMAPPAQPPNMPPVGAPPNMPPPNMGKPVPMPGMRPPMPPNMGGPMAPPTGFTGQTPGDGGPLGNLFMSLPQGTEEAFGAAPPGFNNTLRKPPGLGNGFF